MAAGCCVPLLAALLQRHDSSVIEGCAEALLRLAEGSEPRSAAVEAAGCLPLLVTNLALAIKDFSNKEPRKANMAVSSVQRLAAGSACCRDAIVKWSCVPPLVALLLSDRSQHVNERAVQILHCLASRRATSTGAPLLPLAANLRLAVSLFRSLNLLVGI